MHSAQESLLSGHCLGNGLESDDVALKKIERRGNTVSREMCGNVQSQRHPTWIMIA